MRERIGGQVEHFDCICSYKITVIIIIIIRRSLLMPVASLCVEEDEVAAARCEM